MKELTIISGKGGTGKTSVTASFASLAKNKVLADADVDAANLYLVVPTTVRHEENFQGGHKAIINDDFCTECGDCIERCQYGAISDDFVVNPLSCEGCGVCVHFCPAEAISFPQITCGKWFISDTPAGPMVHAKLGIAEESSGMLVSLVRKQARMLAEKQGFETIITDGPPGIGCPVIAASTGADALLIVTEPTLSGKHDMERVGKLAEFLRVPAMLCINKYDLNQALSEEIQNMAENMNICFVGNIPYHRDVSRAMVAGKSIVDFSDGEAAQAIRKIWEKVEKFLKEGT
jgi:MinD superfamily P-loop ATPase